MAYREVGAFDAKTRLSELLRQVERGERFTITHRGRAIADLVPSAGGAPDAAAAIAAMLAFDGVPGVADEDVADWIADGRQLDLAAGRQRRSGVGVSARRSRRGRTFARLVARDDRA